MRSETRHGENNSVGTRLLSAPLAFQGGPARDRAHIHTCRELAAPRHLRTVRPVHRGRQIRARIEPLRRNRKTLLLTISEVRCPQWVDCCPSVQGGKRTLRLLRARAIKTP